MTVAAFAFLQEMEAQSMLFLVAGFENTSAGLAFVAYELALHPDVQDKLRQEVDEHFPGEQVHTARIHSVVALRPLHTKVLASAKATSFCYLPRLSTASL